MGGEGEGGGMEPLIPAERIRNRVRELADEIERAHPAGQEIHLVGVLKGRALQVQRPAKKSELLRAGLHALAGLSPQALARALDALAPVKAGRPKKK